MGLVLSDRFMVECDRCGKSLMNRCVGSWERFVEYLLYRGWIIFKGKWICDKCSGVNDNDLKCIFVNSEEVSDLDSLNLHELFFLQRELGRVIESKLSLRDDVI